MKLHDLGESQAAAVLRSAKGRLAEHTQEEWNKLEHFEEYQYLTELVKKAEGVLKARRRYREEREKAKGG